MSERERTRVCARVCGITGHACGCAGVGRPADTRTRHHHGQGQPCRTPHVSPTTTVTAAAAAAATNTQAVPREQPLPAAAAGVAPTRVLVQQARELPGTLLGSPLLLSPPHLPHGTQHGRRHTPRGSGVGAAGQRRGKRLGGHKAGGFGGGGPRPRGWRRHTVGSHGGGWPRRQARGQLAWVPAQRGVCGSGAQVGRRGVCGGAGTESTRGGGDRGGVGDGSTHLCVRGCRGDPGVVGPHGVLQRHGVAAEALEVQPPVVKHLLDEFCACAQVGGRRKGRVWRQAHAHTHGGEMRQVGAGARKRRDELRARIAGGGEKIGSGEGQREGRGWEDHPHTRRPLATDAHEDATIPPPPPTTQHYAHAL
jgi:hypothetical protein